MLESLGKYQIQEMIGRGGMGVVYKAVDPDIGRTVAVKTIDTGKEESLTDTLTKQILREARTAGNLHHANIVTIFDFGSQDGTPYIVMEFVNGGDLRRLLSTTPRLPYDRAIQIILQVLSALQHAHDHGVIHRDLKPANFMLDGEQIKVMDFGIAKFHGSDTTGGQAFLGTPAYMSPEQCRGDKLNPSSDLFSLGVIFYELLTGLKPFYGDNPTQLMYKILQETPVPLEKAGDDKSLSRFQKIVDKAIAKNPDDRFQTATEFVDAIQAELSGQPMPERPRSTFSLNDEEHGQLSRALVKYLGPVAPTLLRRALLASKSKAELCDTLSLQIPNESERTLFLKEVGKAASAEPTIMRAAVASNIIKFTAEFLQKAESALARSMGPLAKVMVQRDASQAGGEEELIERLSKHITNKAEQQKFKTSFNKSKQKS